MRQQIEDVIGLDAHDALEISAKTGKGVEEVLEAIVHRLPAPKGDANSAAEGAAGRQLVRPYLGVVVLVRIFDGMLHQRPAHQADGDGGLLSDRPRRHLPPQAGDARPARTGRDRLLHRLDPPGGRHPRRRHGHRREEARRAAPLAGFKPAQPVVFCGLFPGRCERVRERCARRSASSASTMRASPTRWRPPPRSASASAAAFSGSCISRSSASGSSASSIST